MSETCLVYSEMRQIIKSISKEYYFKSLVIATVLLSVESILGELIKLEEMNVVNELKKEGRLH